MAAQGRWEVELLANARAGLIDILGEHGDDAFDQALNEILALEEDPTPEDAERLWKTKDHYRIYIHRLWSESGREGSVYLKGDYERW